MKFDMGGSAAILCAAKAIGEIKHPGVEVSFSHSHSFEARAFLTTNQLVFHNQAHFIVAVCENMISGTGMRHGDVK